MQNKGRTLKKCGQSLYSYENIISCLFSSTCTSLRSHTNPTLLPIHISCYEKLMKYYGSWMHAHTHAKPTMCMRMKMHIGTQTKKGWGRKQQINVTFHNTTWENKKIKKVNQKKVNWISTIKIFILSAGQACLM